MYTKLVGFMLAVIGLMGLVGMRGHPAAAQVDVGQRSSLAAAQPFGLAYRWHTFYGIPEDTGESRGVAVDVDGNVYITGYSSKTWGTPLHAYSGDDDIMIVKLNSLGVYQWHTFYGAAPTSTEDGDDECAGIAVDSGGNVYITGYSDRTWQGPGGAEPLNAHGGDSEYMFALKLNGSGAYQWHSFFQPGRANAIDVDGNGVYIAGVAAATWGTPLHAFEGNNLVALKVNSDGAYQWHTYYGSAENTAEETAAYGIVGDAAHDAVYITGQSPNHWPGEGAVAPLHAFSGGSSFSVDIVVLKLDGAGAYQWHTFYGADSTDERGRGIAIDDDGNPYVAGQAYGTWDTPLHANSGNSDIAVLKLNRAGAYQWHTFYGSNGDDAGAGIAVGNSGGVYIAGVSNAGWLGDGGAQPAHPYSESLAEIVALKLDTNGAFRRHTFYGASDADDTGMGIAVDSNHGVFVTGLSVATWQGDNNANPLHAHSGNSTGDSFVLKLDDQESSSLYLPLVIR